MKELMKIMQGSVEELKSVGRLYTMLGDRGRPGMCYKGKTETIYDPMHAAVNKA